MRTKKIICCLAAFVFATGSYAQSIKATIKRGSQANSVYVVLKPSAGFTGTPTNFQFTLAVSKSVGTRPVMSVRVNRYSAYLPDVGVTLVQSASYSNSYVYLANFSQPTFASKTYLANAEDTVAEFSFAGSFGMLSAIQLLQLPNGTASTGAGEENGNYNFYTEFGGNDFTNTAAMFYSVTGGTVSNNSAGYTALSSVNVGSAALPVKWLAFDVRKEGNNAVLNWRVQEDGETSHYELERSTNGTGFTTLTVLPASGAAQEKTYTAADSNLTRLQSAAVFYRIKQVDRNGRAFYSETRSLLLTQTNAMAIYPNPCTDGFYVSFQNTWPDNVLLQLCTASGQILNSRLLSTAQANPLYYNVRTLALKPGTYYLNAYSAGKVLESRKVVVR